MFSYKKLVLALAVTLGLGSTAYAKKNLAAGKYKIDAAHSSVGFEIPHLMISSVDGKFTDYEGTFDIHKNFKKSKINVSIEAKSIDTAVKKRDDHLRSADFFEVSKYPKITFKSTSIKGKPGDFKIKGDLTIKGVTKPVTLEGKYLGTVKDGYGNTKIAFEAETEISRKDFGITYNNIIEAGPVIGDEVDIELKIQAALQK